MQILQNTWRLDLMIANNFVLCVGFSFSVHTLKIAEDLGL